MEQREDGKWKRYKLLKLHVLFNFFFLHLKMVFNKNYAKNIHPTA
jgi:hypothetical protein